MGIGTILSGLNTTGISKGQPYLNSMITTIRNTRTNTILNQRRKALYMKTYETENSILTGIINIVAKDVCEDVFFEPLTNIGSSRNKILKAEEFYIKNDVEGMNFSLVIDSLMTGESYIYKNQFDKKTIMKEVDRQLELKGFPISDKTRRLYLKANEIDEEQLMLRNIRYIASSTMENIYDEHEIKKYIQRVGSNFLEFSRDEIIRIKYMDVNGRPNGFTSVGSMITALKLDYFMWKNMVALSENGGQPDRVYSVEDLDINSPAFKRIEGVLAKYHKLPNRHGSLLLNGKMKIDDLQQLDQMQFKDLGFYIASLLALQWSVPRSRLPFIVGGTNTKEDTGGNSEKNYYDNINFFQRRHEGIMNRQLWIPHFGVKMKFKRTYLQDEVRETTNQQLRLNNLTFMNDEFAKADKRLKPDYIIRYINRINEEVSLDDLEEKPEEVPEFPGQMRQGLPSNDDLNKNSDKKNKDAKKKREQENVADKRGKPNGYGKERSSNPSVLEIKEMLKEDLIEFKETQRVPFLTFVRLYKEDNSFGDGLNRVFMSTANEMTRFTYKSSDFVYETIVPTLEVSKINLMNFHNLYRLPEVDMLSLIETMGEGESVE